jgi:hypothetical protein
MNMMRVGRMSRQRYKRRANALPALGDTIAAVQTIFGPVLPHQAIAALVEAAPHLSKYGITVIQNGLHSPSRGPRRGSRTDRNI